MKKVSLLLVIALSLFIMSCDGTSNEDDSGLLAGMTPHDDTGEVTVDPADPIVLTEEQNDANAAATIAIVNEGLQGINLENLFTNAWYKDSGQSVLQTIDWDSLFSGSSGLNYAIPLGTVYNQDGMEIDACLILGLTDGIGIGLTFDLDDYQLQTGEDPLPTVSGQIVVGMTCKFNWESIFTQTPSAVMVTMYTPMDDQLVYTGGILDGQKIGLDDVELEYSMSSFSIGSPISMSGAAIINDVVIPFDSKILELLIGLM